MCVCEYLGHVYLTVGLEQYPPGAHSDEVGAKAGPGFVVDLVEQGQGVVRSRHVAVAEGDVSRCHPGAQYQDYGQTNCALKVPKNYRKLAQLNLI